MKALCKLDAVELSVRHAIGTRDRKRDNVRLRLSRSARGEARLAPSTPPKRIF